MSITDIFLIIGGLGLLLFGMKMMSTGLEVVAGDSLQNILKRATSNRFLAVFVGIFATVCLTSSTAVTIITVGFVNSGLLNLTQSVGVIIGANVGTTFSAQLIAFKIDAIAPLFIFTGVVMYLFFNNRKVKNIGYVILGFGILFFSISVMGSPLKTLAKQPSFIAILTTFENPFLALFAGFVFTAIVQSSSATTGLLVTMHLSGIPMTFETSAFIILGTNIGTSTTTMIASIPANRNSKRAALFHIAYDIFGCMIFGTLIYTFPAILSWFEMTWAEKARQVAMFHTLYNVATMILLLPLIKWAVILLQKVIPQKESETIDDVYEKKLQYLVDEPEKYPAMANVNAAHLELCRMARIANTALTLALESFFEKDEDKAQKAMKIEKVVNFLYHQISYKLVKINNMPLSEIDSRKTSKMFKTLSDIERISDHAENIAEYTMIITEGNLKFSDTAIDELKVLGELVTQQITRSINTYENLDTEALPQIKSYERDVDKLAKDLSENHISRLKLGSCDPQSGVLFTDMIIDLERTADHAKNIALSIVLQTQKEGRSRGVM
jgi:phosphate:Na+ symporter